uniref:Vomeronasal type-1 receptor n=1 Tax=Panthera leo TaxID=9689 RepID=A0A8C8XX50_PANLE
CLLLYSTFFLFNWRNLGVLITFQTGIGRLGDFLLFVVYLHVASIRPHQKKPLDAILVHLTLADVTTATFRGVPYITSSFGVRDVLEAVQNICKAVLCIHRVARGLCICAASLLSTFQALMISPAGSRWAWLKSKIYAQILPLLVYSWASKVPINTWVIISTVVTGNSAGVGPVYSPKFCKTRRFAYHQAMLLRTVMFMQDFFFLFLMIWTSFYMVTVLFRHHKTALRIHATRVALLLVSCFVFFYGANTCLSIYMGSFYEKNLMPERESITSFLSFCYPMVCALMLIKYGNRVSRYACAFSNMIIFPCSQLGFLLHLKNTDKNRFNCKRTRC